MNEWIEESNESAGASWLAEFYQPGNSIETEVISHYGTSEYENAGLDLLLSPNANQDLDIEPAITAIVNMIPSIIQAVSREEIEGVPQDEYALTEELVEAFWEAKPADQSDEIWGAIVGALTSIIPRVIPAIKNLIKNRQQAKRRRRERSQRQPGRPVVSRQSYFGDDHSDNYHVYEDTSGDSELLDDEAAATAALATIAPIALKMLPALVPVISQLIQTGLPLVAQAAQGMAGGAQRTPPAPVAAPVAPTAAVANQPARPTPRAKESEYAFYETDASNYDQFPQHEEDFEGNYDESEYEGDPIFI